MRMVIARCSATYSGRLSSTLASGMRLIMVKADGCVAIHADIGAYKPLNWMNAPNTVTELEDRWVVTNPSGERLEIVLEEVIEDLRVSLDTERGLTMDGIERELQLLLADHPDHIERGLTTVTREFRTDIGPVDILCRDGDGRSVAVEIKRIGEIDGVEQLTRYLERMQRDPELAPVRGILAATTVKPQARVLAESRGIGWVEVDLALLRGEEELAPRLFPI
ncbi:MAG: endonuclease NucS [Actinomycetota bacterium]|jgi:endonuclease|nr:endonuclease NucS [Actinomycetota bacterium]